MNVPVGDSRPLVTGRFYGAWLVLVSAILVGLKEYYDNWRIGIWTWEPGGLMGVNYHVYHVAAEAALAGEPFYEVVPPGAQDSFVYLYPPITVTTFYPFTLVEWTTGFAILTGLSVLGGVIGTYLLVQYIENKGVELGWVDLVLIFSLFTLSTHVMGTIYFGNINILLGVAFVVGFWALSTRRDGVAGTVFAIAALYKVFPAIVGVWLLRDRRWRAVIAAGVTGIGGIIVGGIVFGIDTTIYYFTHVLTRRGGSTAFVGGYPVDGTYYVTIQQPLSHILWRIWPTAPYDALVVFAIVVCGAVLAYFYRDVDGLLPRLMAIFATVAVTVVLFPSFRFYIALLFFPLVPLLYLWTAGPGRFAFLFGGAVMSITYRPGDVVVALERLPEPLFWVGYQIAGFANLQVYGIAVMVIGCGWYLRYREIPQTADTDRPVLQTE